MRSTQRHGQPTATVVGRVAALLGAFGTDDGEVGFAELARRTGLPKSTVYRMATELMACGLLERHGAAVRLGLRLFELGQRVPQQRRLRDAALPYMTDLREATQKTVHLAVLEQSEVVYLEILHSSDAPPMPSRIGGRVPAHATGVGKAILAFAPPEVVQEVLSGELPRLSAHTIVAPGLLRRELERVRRTGVAYDREESGAGTVCVASPVRGYDNTAAGALSVSGWSSRMDLERMAPAVHTAALALSRDLNASARTYPR